jgi:hypothetical protein
MDLQIISISMKAKAHNILTDIELARMHGNTELIEKLHKKFYAVIPHNNNNPILTENQIYVKKALLMASIKQY